MKRRKSSVVGFVFSNDKTQILLIKRRDVPAWALPGGGVDPGESPQEAVVREIREETGLTASIKRPVAMYTPICSLANDSYTFECAVVSGALATGDETMEDQISFPLKTCRNRFSFCTAYGLRMH